MKKAPRLPAPRQQTVAQLFVTPLNWILQCGFTTPLSTTSLLRIWSLTTQKKSQLGFWETTFSSACSWLFIIFHRPRSRARPRLSYLHSSSRDVVWVRESHLLIITHSYPFTSRSELTAWFSHWQPLASPLHSGCGLRTTSCFFPALP